MVAIRTKPCLQPQRGTTLIEVLVTVVILAIGLLGLAKLQARMQASEMEAYQRAQALVLLNDMISRISTNRISAASYLTDLTAVGAGMTCPTDVSTRQRADIKEWCDALQGAGEASGTDKVGAVVGGRGCIESLGNNEYLITVAWQGLTPLSAPPSSVGCGQGEYNGGTESDCVDDRCRRTVTATLSIGTL
jgi:type IV pilus assembly protein PilV